LLLGRVALLLNIRSFIIKGLGAQYDARRR